MPKIFDFEDDWDYRNPKETYEKFLKYTEKAKEHENPEYYPQLFTQIARTQSLQHDFEEAKGYLETAKQEITINTPVALIRYHLELGRVHNTSGDKDKAKPEFLVAWEQALKHKEDDFAIDAAHMMAIVEKDPHVQIEWNEKGIDLAEKTTDPKAKKWLGSLYNNTAWSYIDQNDFTKAMKLAESALKLRLDDGKPINIVIARWLIGRIHRYMEDFENAKATQEEVMKERASYDLGPDGYNHEELFEINLALGNESIAKNHAKKALELLKDDKWFMKNENERYQRLVGFSKN